MAPYRRLIFYASVSLAMAAAPVGGQYLGPAPYQLVLATVGSLEEAESEAHRAAHLLERGIDTRSLDEPTPGRVSRDGTISVHHTDSGHFVIVGGAGGERYLRAVLVEARRYFPTAHVEPSPTVNSGHHLFFGRRGVVVAGSFETYAAALEAATRVADRSGLPYDSRGLIHDRERGLVLPDSAKGPDAGRYLSRRHDECGAARRPCISVERSSAYDGFEPGLFIVVAGVMRRSEARDVRLAALRRVVPDAYVKETNLWMGCRH